jgi:parallel beta-helix repeat protein
MKKLTKIILILISTIILSCLTGFTANAQLLENNKIIEYYDIGLISYSGNLIIVDDEPGYDYEQNNPPEDYTRIHDAIQASHDNDIIYVFKGIYNEKLVINKEITLLGEEKESTVINGDGTGDVIYVSADNVKIIGFTVKNSGDYEPNYHQAGIELDSNYNIIQDNIICDNLGNGVFFNSSRFNTVYGNIISNNNLGAYFENSSNNTLSNNKITDNEIAACLYYANNNAVIFNDLSNNHLAMCTNNATLNNISRNIISNNDIGLYPYYSSGNTITYNNFIDNKKRNVNFRGNCKNKWEGNYWNRRRFLPKLIFGRTGRLGLIPQINFDLKPAREPNNIKPKI